MRALHLINAFNRGGVERWLLNMLAEIPKDQCRMDVCCKGANIGPWAPIALDHGAQVYHCPLRPSQIGFIRGLRRILSETKYDLIHNHLGIYSGLAVWVAKTANVPIVTTFHSSSFPAASRLLALPVIFQMRRVYAFFSIRYAINQSDMVTAVSPTVLNAMVPEHSPFREKTAVLYLGVDIPPQANEQGKAMFRQSFGWAGDMPVVVHVGRFYSPKNHFGLLEAFERVLRDVPDAKLLLVGDGPLFSRVQERIRAKGIEHAVRMLGPRDDAASIMAKCDVLLFPSFWEGFGIVPLEANAAGVPVVGSRAIGLNGAVEDKTTALLSDATDAASLALSVVRILGDRDLAGTLGRAGRARAEKLFSRKAAADRLLGLYNDLLSRSRRISR